MLGFDLRIKKEKAENVIVEPEGQEKVSVIPTVVEVKFEDGRQYPYYNDKFDLKENDVVFVDGKLFGKPGRVVSVTDKFKISLEYYKKVLSVLDLNFHGSFKKELWYMINEGDTDLSFEQVKGWFVPLSEAEELFIKGKGDSADLEHGFEVSENEMSDAEDIVERERCLFISVINGEGKAIIKGKGGYHTVEFNLQDGSVLTDVYCDCIKPCSCSHMEAISMLLYFFKKHEKIDLEKDFNIISQKLFYSVISYVSPKITL